MKILRLLALIVFLMVGSRSFAATYYVDYTNGNDANNGTSQTTAWKYAPGMYACSAVCNSTTLQAGDRVILKGCQTWHNESFPWQTKFSGAGGNPIYYGVNTTWWDSSVSGCSSAWNRPVLNPDAASISHSNTYMERLVYFGSHSNQTFDNFEVKNVLHDDGYGNDEVTTFDFGDGSNGNNIVQNMYIHAWISPYFAIGTGNVAANSNVITNFVPFSYSPHVPAAGWASLHWPVAVQVHGYWPVQSNGPIATSISGSGPYQIATNSSTLPSACNGCVVQIGGDYGYIFGGVEGACVGCISQNNVIDGSDTAEAQLNPAGDCGASEGNNQFCVGSAIVGWRLPNIWRNNVIRYVASAFVGECSEWSGNLIEYIRLSINPSAHTNAIECLDETPSNNVYYNNVERHTNNPNPSVPGGQWSIGLFNQVTPRSGYTSYVFNNVTYDGLQNVPWGLYPSGKGCCGSVVFFDNTGDGGPSWTSMTFDLINPCPSSYAACRDVNNDLISNISSSAFAHSASNTTNTTNVVQSVAAASAQGYTSSETYAYSPGGGGATIGVGTVVSSLPCATIALANPAAGAACLSDTTYGAAYNTKNHTAVAPARSPSLRGAAADVGAYLPGGSLPVSPATALVATPH